MQLLSNTPDSIEKFCGFTNKNAIKTFKEFLNHKHGHILLVTGPTGSGKTKLCELILKNHLVLESDDNNIIESFMKNNSIVKQSKVLYFENYTAIDYNIITNTNSLIIYSFEDEKKIPTTVHKNIHTITLSYPNISDAFIYLSDLFTEYNIKYDENTLVERTKSLNGNIREIILNTLMDSGGIDNNFRHLDNFQITRSLMCNHNKYINTKPTDDLVYYLYYENFPESTKKPNLLQTYIDINSIFVDASILERCSADISKELKHSSLCIYDKTKKTFDANTSMRFSQILSKMSHKNITNKKVKNLPTLDIICLSDFVNTTVKSGYLATYQKYFM